MKDKIPHKTDEKRMERKAAEFCKSRSVAAPGISREQKEKKGAGISKDKAQERTEPGRGYQEI